MLDEEIRLEEKSTSIPSQKSVVAMAEGKVARHDYLPASRNSWLPSPKNTDESDPDQHEDYSDIWPIGETGTGSP
jgi:hypothetical protein